MWFLFFTTSCLHPFISSWQFLVLRRDLKPWESGGRFVSSSSFQNPNPSQNAWTDRQTELCIQFWEFSKPLKLIHWHLIRNLCSSGTFMPLSLLHSFASSTVWKAREKEAEGISSTFLVFYFNIKPTTTHARCLPSWLLRLILSQCFHFTRFLSLPSSPSS